MTEERWAELLTATWFQREQDEVTAYTEHLRTLLAEALRGRNNLERLTYEPETSTGV